jgi:uncharacterized protein (DUF1810 family)
MTRQQERFAKLCENIDDIRADLKDGVKTRHWSWYTFPFFYNHAFTEQSKYYRIQDYQDFNDVINDTKYMTMLKEICESIINIGMHKFFIEEPFDAYKMEAFINLFSNCPHPNCNWIREILKK